MAASRNSEDASSLSTQTDEKPSKESLVHSTSPENKDDADLDHLLDSALSDFDGPLHPPSASASSQDGGATSTPGLNILTTKVQDAEEKKENKESKTPSSQDALFEALFSESPAAMQSEAEFGNVLSGLLSDLNLGEDAGMPADLQKMFQNLAEMGPIPPTPSSGVSADGSTDNPDELTSTLADTMTRLAQNARDLQEGQIPDEELLRSLGGMNLEEGDAELLPMVQTMMHSLLSKDVLYPSLKEVVDKYQGWLDENKTTISSSDHQRYSEQHRIMMALCTEYEGEQDSDSVTVRQQRMTKIMDLIQKMESLGQPPAEIVGDMNTGLTFDENGLPRIPGLPSGEQCAVM
ncbi:peroxisomal biogenesis factor 19-like [Diadema antillarum]|uniref:peroxisomal biogenesis factor 19-like n=2 Tax=Diadema antillarum TaxID=105358 RepID=UPI003A8BDF28